MHSDRQVTSSKLVVAAVQHAQW